MPSIQPLRANIAIYVYTGFHMIKITEGQSSPN